MERTTTTGSMHEVQDDVLPKMNDSLDSYYAKLTGTIARIEVARENNVRTNDFTITRFEDTKRDRLWRLKVIGKLVDSVMLCPDDGYKEV